MRSQGQADLVGVLDRKASCGAARCARLTMWRFWAVAGLWVLLEILFLQTPLASAREGEYRAAAISWIAGGVTAAAGVLGGFLQGQSKARAR